MTSMDELLDDFFQNESPVFSNYVEVIDDPGELVTSIVFLTDQMEKIENFSKLNRLEHYYLTYLPKEAVIFPDEVLAIHEVLLDFYQYLYKKSYLTTKDYKNILLFFQKNKHTFIEKMSNDQYWSKEKQQQLDEIDETILDSMPNELEQLFKNLGKQFQPNLKTKDDNKILHFPTGRPQNRRSYAIQLRIDLKGFKPPIWRRVLVFPDSTLTDLHEIIQKCFEWENEHLYQFIADGHYYAPEENTMDDFWGPISEDAASITIGEIFSNTQTINYIYDFGDYWEHKIKFETDVSFDELSNASGKLSNITADQLPICLTGRQDAPLEDSRGEEEFAPFDLEKINIRLADL
ncbi:plasmid pRiA4b ORF-3 family protein [Tetragenococcus solitarius]|uniref:Plasmid pRiA4b Orf3-like domain-containing protein n=1 Tax=Tetragenococcus solitarius TaxID=71453 RepID=A0ABP6KNA5_9ENTE|nr:plasmid pRiA4b ORF-3 family protein [Tetragenococcus solitarius]